MINFKKQSNQKGDAVIGALVAIFIISLMLIQIYFPISGEYYDTIKDSRTKRDLTTIMEAVISHRTDEAESWFGTYPASIAVLQTRGYLQGFANFNIVGEPYVLGFSGRDFTISTDLQDVDRAKTQAAIFGNSVSVLGTVVTLNGYAPGDELSHIALLPTDGSRPMLGDLHFDPTADIQLNENELRSAKLLEARTAAGDGVVDADVVNADSGVFRDLRVVY